MLILAIQYTKKGFIKSFADSILILEGGGGVLDVTANCNYNLVKCITIKSLQHAMQFEWDEQKNALNIQKHGIDFSDTYELFRQHILVLKDERKDYKEHRYIGVGYIQQRIMVLVFTRPKKDSVRVISLRKANKREQEKFKRAIQN